MKKEKVKVGLQRKELLQALDAVKAGLAKEEIIEQSTHFVFMDEIIATYNNDICVIYPLLTQMKCSIDSTKLYGLVQGISDDETISMKMEKDRISIKTKNIRSTINCVEGSPINDYISSIRESLKSTKGMKWESLPKNFGDAVSACLFSVSKNAVVEEAFHSIFVNKKYIISSDGLRISRYTMSKGVKESFLIPFSAATELIRYKLTDYCCGDSWIHFKTEDNAYFNCRRIDSTFPETDKFFTINGKSVELPEALIDVVKNISVFTDGSSEMDKRINLQFTKGMITCRAEDESGWIERDIETEYKGRDVSVDIHPIFFQQILKKVANMTIGETSALFTTEKFEHVLALPVKE